MSQNTTALSDWPIPSNIEAEKKIIGSLLTDPKTLEYVTDNCTSVDFYPTKHRLLFDAVLQLQREGSPVDIVTLESVLKFDDAAEYLAEISGCICAFESIPHYIKLIKNTSIRRQVMTTALQIAEKASNENLSTEAIIFDAKEKLSEIDTRKKTPRNFFQTLNCSCDRFSDSPQEMPTIIDGMLLKGIVSMLYSAGGTGKSTLFLNMAVKVALANITKVDFFGHNVQGGNVFLLSGEDPEPILNKRLIEVIKAIANECGLEYSLVRKSVNDHLRIGSTVGHCVQLFTLDNHSGTLEKSEYFESFIESLESDKFSLVAIDTKARFSPGEGSGNNVATQEIQHFETIATETGASVMLLHHTNKMSRNGFVSGTMAFRDATALYDSVRACWYLRTLTEQELSCEGIQANNAQYYTLLENTKNNYLPLNETLVLKRLGYGFEAKPIAPRLNSDQKKELRAEEDLKNLLSILQINKSGSWTLRNVIDICKGKLSKARAMQALKVSVDLDYVLKERSSDNVNSHKYKLTEAGKNYETVPNF